MQTSALVLAIAILGGALWVYAGGLAAMLALLACAPILYTAWTEDRAWRRRCR